MEMINLIYSNQIILIIVFGMLGLLIGSFLNVVIHRLPIMMKAEYKKNCLEYLEQEAETPDTTFNLMQPRSRCPVCKKLILWWQNIPLVSFITLKGKCNKCENKISWRYPLIEMLTAIATIFVVIHFGDDHIKTFSTLILTWSLIAAIFIDFEHLLLPDNITFPLIWIGLLINIGHTFVSPENAIIGAIAGYLSLWSIAKIFKLIRKMEGMGHGDFKLLAVFGAWLGWKTLPFIILASSFLGAIVGIYLIFIKKHLMTKPMPFGPYIAIAGWLALFWGNDIIRWYLNVLL